jgi:hypothetical protein
LDRLSVTYFNLASDVADWAVAPAQLRIDGRWIEPLLQGARASVLVVVGGGLLYTLAVALRWCAGKPLSAAHKTNVLFVVFLTAVIFVSEGQPRYLFPLYPFFIVGVAWLGSRAASES